jgi:GntR family transcriptional regulator/MocR family aminotransferase
VLLGLDGIGPRYAQITRALSAAIQAGALVPGSRLPSTRDLAADLGCARNLVLLAYEQLVLEGYLVTRAGAGTFVSPHLAPPRPPTHGTGPPPVARLAPAGARIVAGARVARRIMRPMRGLPVDFMYGICRPDARILDAMRAAFARALREGAYAYGPAAGDADLRQGLAGRLRGARGIARPADRLVVTAGAQQALDICARLLVTPGDRVIVEDPSYVNARAIFEAAGARIAAIPVDRHGLDVDRLRSDRRAARIVYVTPSHQFPTGAVLPVARRYALLEWARARGAYVIEDDYDGEFRYAGRPIPALAAIDPEGPVIYIGTFAKALCPAMRLGYLSLPAELVEPAVQAKWLTDFGSSLLLQKTVGALMATGEYDRHVRRMARRYRARRDALVEALTRHLAAEAVVDGSGGGLHVVVWLPRLGPDRVEALVEACAARDVAVYPVAPHAIAPPARAGLLLGYGLVEPEAIEEGVQRLADVFGQLVKGNRGRAVKRRSARPGGPAQSPSDGRSRRSAGPHRTRG